MIPNLEETLSTLSEVCTADDNEESSQTIEKRVLTPEVKRESESTATYDAIQRTLDTLPKDVARKRKVFRNQQQQYLTVIDEFERRLDEEKEEYKEKEKECATIENYVLKSVVLKDLLHNEEYHALQSVVSAVREDLKFRQSSIERLINAQKRVSKKLEEREEEHKAKRRSLWKKQLQRFMQLPSGDNLLRSVLYTGLGIAMAAGFYATTYEAPEPAERVVITRTVKPIISRTVKPIISKSLEKQLSDEHIKLNYNRPLFVVDPASHETIVYRVVLFKEMQAKTYTGHNVGPKRRNNDHKTPENLDGEIFEMVSVPDYTHATSPFNPKEHPYNGLFGRIDTKDGRIARMCGGHSPIGLHGLGDRAMRRHEDGTPFTYNITHGCIAFENEVHNEMIRRGYFKKGTQVLVKSGILGEDR